MNRISHQHGDEQYCLHYILLGNMPVRLPGGIYSCPQVFNNFMALPLLARTHENKDIKSCFKVVDVGTGELHTGT
jgi:hypothetical protein